MVYGDWLQCKVTHLLFANGSELEADAEHKLRRFITELICFKGRKGRKMLLNFKLRSEQMVEI